MFTYVKTDPIFLTEQILRVMAPFRPGSISYELNETHDRGKFLRISIGSLPRHTIKISLDPWYTAYPDEMNQILYEEFKKRWDRIYVQPDDHIELGTE